MHKRQWYQHLICSNMVQCISICVSTTFANICIYLGSGAQYAGTDPSASNQSSEQKMGHYLYDSFCLWSYIGRWREKLDKIQRAGQLIRVGFRHRSTLMPFYDWLVIETGFQTQQTVCKVSSLELLNHSCLTCITHEIKIVVKSVIHELY